MSVAGPMSRTRPAASEPLEADVTLAGPIEARLIVSTTGTDSDWIVKLIDVWPDDALPPDQRPLGPWGPCSSPSSWP